MVKVWKAREVLIRVGTATTAVAATALSTTFGSAGAAITGLCKNITISEPEGSVEKIDLLGQDSSLFQNAELEDKPFGAAKVSGTLVHPGDEGLEFVAYGAGTAVASTHTRFQPGNTGRPTNAYVYVELDDASDEVAMLLQNARFTKIGDRKIGGADGHFEQDFEATCLPKDFFIEFKN